VIVKNLKKFYLGFLMVIGFVFAGNAFAGQMIVSTAGCSPLDNSKNFDLSDFSAYLAGKPSSGESGIWVVCPVQNEGLGNVNMTLFAHVYHASNNHGGGTYCKLTKKPFGSHSTTSKSTNTATLQNYHELNSNAAGSLYVTNNDQVFVSCFLPQHTSSWQRSILYSMKVTW